jgi:hypothetical protein
VPPDTIILPLRERDGRVPPVTHVRGTLIAASLRVVRERECLNEYLARLPKEHHAKVLQSVAGEWVTIQVGMAHYEAMESLGFSVLDQLTIGRDTALRIQGGVLGTLARLATNVGVTPWVAIEQFQRLWDRLLQGGSAAVYKVGAKEARLECHGVPMARFAYFRNGWRGMIAASCEMFAKKAYAQELTAFGGSSAVAYRLAWA